MEFNECRTNEVLDPVDIEFHLGRSRTPSPTPVLTTNVCCDLEDILSDVRTIVCFSCTKHMISYYVANFSYFFLIYV